MRWHHYILVVLAIAMLFAVRAFEQQLFYDPLLQFFHTDFREAQFPEFQHGKHLLSISMRYTLNALIGIAIIHLLFRDKRHTSFALITYLLIGAICLSIYAFWLSQPQSLSYTAAFYVRRVLLQPMLLLLLVPAFYYLQLSRAQTRDA
ncbi:MAG: exosortase F system-associated protein [Weeksellaceae bacterium]|nr:exosortase F system-associated protein [Weeksellaceae bacterium]